MRPRAAVSAAVAMVGMVVTPTLAAMELAMSVSPAEGVVGAPVEVLIRTFTPFGSGAIELPAPSVAYAAPSGLWNVLYPFPDYAFAVTATSPAGRTIAIDLALDADDASLWRGRFTPDAPGQWTIRLANATAIQPIMVTISSHDDRSPLIAVIALATGLLAGVALGRFTGRAPAYPKKA
jgi:hypothetical protein